VSDAHRFAHPDEASAQVDVLPDHLDRQLLEATIANAPVGLAILDRERRVLRCNAMFAHQAGRPAADIIGMNLVSLVHPEEQQHADWRTAAIRDGHIAADAIDRRLARPDGQRMIVDVQISPLDGADGFMVVRSIDVTERHRLVDRLTRYRYFFDHSNDFIVVLDGDLRVTEASPSVWRDFGIGPAADDPTDRLRDLVHPDDLAAFRAHLDQALDDTSTITFTVRTGDASGAWRHLEFVAVNLLHEPAIDGIVLTARDVSDRVRATQDLAFRASHDSLTGLANREQFISDLGRSLAQSERNRRSIAVVYLDLDAFKEVNDELGHAVGDHVLAGVGRALLVTVRKGDTAARLGGDEFVVLLDPVDGIDHANAVAERLRLAVNAAIQGALPDHRELRSTQGRTPGVSCGVALSRHADSVESICKRADDALYRNKAAATE
jgi:diguanylate cyclase (GGDEF)-like protein/PAS domain S-box-containing protein